MQVFFGDDMIFGIGNDLVNTSRIKDLLDKFGEKFLNRIYSAKEQERFRQLQSKEQQLSFLAKRFAAKEAFSKALGIGISSGLSFNEIEVINDTYGKPTLNICGNSLEILQDKTSNRNIKLDLSLSDDYPFASAFVIISYID